MSRVGIVSDTHGLIRPELVAALKNVDLIIHAGDVGSEWAWHDLQKVAPVIAVRGNVNTGEWALNLPEIAELKFEGCGIFVIHNVAHLPNHPGAMQADVIVYGHSHKPSLKVNEGIRRLNPGSAGPRRFRLPISIVMAELSQGRFVPEFINLLTGESFHPSSS